LVSFLLVPRHLTSDKLQRSSLLDIGPLEPSTLSLLPSHPRGIHFRQIRGFPGHKFRRRCIGPYVYGSQDSASMRVRSLLGKSSINIVVDFGDFMLHIYTNDGLL